MLKSFVVLLLSGMVLGQADVPGQFRAIKALMPEASTVAVILDGRGSKIEGELGQASSENGLKVVKVPIQSIRDMAAALNAAMAHNPNFIYIEDSDGLGGKNSIKFVAKSALKNQVPVFTTHPDALDAGAFGQMQKGDAGWTILVNGKVKDQYSIAIPDGNDRFLVQN
ncbi:MAG: hypothetical protein H6510_17255 [Acidobacteria bacterium]|nr:hypothetical protein [Acidobacteriota bacterium]MCB9399563.1 hypothetical protein [Acidobacteriota bacterium]